MTSDRPVSPAWIYWVGLCVLALTAGYAAPQLASSLFSAGGFMPHGVCYTWMPPLLWLHLASDVMIGLAYFSIPVALVYFVRKRGDLPFNWIFVLFGVFIIACGATHFMEVLTLWFPYYWLSGALKAFTAAASVPTAIATVLLIPQALNLPSTSQLRAAKSALEQEVLERRRVEEELRAATVELERRVAERTAELRAANAALQSSQEWLQVTLSSIGDAVIATDLDGRVALMNPVAEGLTGWPAGEAARQPLNIVFIAEDEASGTPIVNPALRAMREGRVVGFANHTIIVARDGTRRPIDDSAAPIRDAEGEVLGAVLVFRDVSGRRANEQLQEQLADDLRESNALLNALFAQAPLGIGVWDDQCRYLRVNDALARMNGIPAAAHLGRRLDAVLPGLDASVMKSLRTVLATGATLTRQEQSGETPAAPGRRRHWNVSYFPVLARDEVEAVGAVWEEITERKEAEAERARLLAAEQAARTEAQRATEAKDQFLATVSHELRTPLQAILGWVQVLETGRLGADDTRRAIDRVASNVREQARLIDDLLDISRIVTGKLHLTFGAVDMTAVVETAVELLRPTAANKGVALVARADATLPSATGDAGRLQQVVWNLLSNAIKFTPSGGRVEVVLCSGADGIRLSVCDTGRGIEPALLPKIFEQFSQGSGAAQGGGLGLGLAIVRHLVQLHGGRVRAASEGSGRGACFEVALPWTAPASRDAAVAPTPTVPAALSGVHVLIVEDAADTREAIMLALSMQGARVTIAASVAEALSRADVDRPDVVVTDIGLPDESGLVLPPRLRAIGIDTPVIALTAYGTPGDRKRSLAAGFVLHLTKPFSAVDLAHAIRDVVRAEHRPT